jgi:hypothetical protein
MEEGLWALTELWRRRFEEKKEELYAMISQPFGVSCSNGVFQEVK